MRSVFTSDLFLRARLLRRCGSLTTGLIVALIAGERGVGTSALGLGDATDQAARRSASVRMRFGGATGGGGEDDGARVED